MAKRWNDRSQKRCDRQTLTWLNGSKKRSRKWEKDF